MSARSGSGYPSGYPRTADQPPTATHAAAAEERWKTRTSKMTRVVTDIPASAAERSWCDHRRRDSSEAIGRLHRRAPEGRRADYRRRGAQPPEVTSSVLAETASARIDALTAAVQQVKHGPRPRPRGPRVRRRGILSADPVSAPRRVAEARRRPSWRSPPPR